MNDIKIETLTFAPVCGKSSIEVNGRVWIGDPCYPPVLNDNWNEGWLAAFRDGESDHSVVVSVNGLEMVAGGTSEGDGCYHVDGADGSCGVDSGLLCVIPEYLFETVGLDGSDSHDGVYVDGVEGTAEIDDDCTVWAGLSVKVITKDRCGNCGDIEGDCFCERCDGCDQWESECLCDDTCIGCMMSESECCCEEEGE